MRLAGLTAGVTGSYVGYMAQRMFLGEEGRDTKRRATHAKAGRRIRDELQLLRGPIMKLGQALSLHTDIVPEEMLAELTKLQMEAPGMHPSLALAQFKASLGRSPEQVFKRFDAEPFAAASLGQVHRAVMRDGDARPSRSSIRGFARRSRTTSDGSETVAAGAGVRPSAEGGARRDGIADRGGDRLRARGRPHRVLQDGPETARVRRRAGCVPRLLDRSCADDVRRAGPAPGRVPGESIPRSGFATSWAAVSSSCSTSRC